MNAEQIVEMLNKAFGLCDMLDRTENFGVYALTNGEHTTRKSLKLELSQFLLYLGNANNSFEDREVALLNLVLEEEYSAAIYENLCTKIDEPSPENSLTLLGFISGDRTLNSQNGTKSTQLSDVLVHLYESLGSLMVAFDYNKAANIRKIKFINSMKSHIMKSIME